LTWLVIVGAAGIGLVPLSLIDQIVLLGVAVVLPLALGPIWWWLAAAMAVLTSFVLPTGPAGLLVLPFLVVAAATLSGGIRTAGPLYFWRRGDVIEILASLYALVAAGALASSRFGIEAFGIHEPIVELTSVHYMFAGTAALVLANATVADASGRWLRAAHAALLSSAVAPPIVAVGFVTRAALPQVGGAILMTLGVWLTATLQLRRAASAWRRPAAAVLLGISGLAVWAPMVLAVAWAAGQHWDVPMLSIPDMARTHGLANALAFVLCGLSGRRMQNTVPVNPSPSVTA
jgi:hypothetical protein